ncbi:hypothetical protein [Streptomyces sp. NPDC054901]
MFDTDGVLLDSARLHAAAWKTAFDSCLGSRTASGKGRQPPFDADHEYRQWVDRKPRLEGAAAFLDARGIDLPAGGPGNAPGTDTVWAVAARKEKEFVRTLEAGTVEAFPMPFGSDLHERFTQYGLPGTRPALRAYVGLSTEGEDKDFGERTPRRAWPTPPRPAQRLPSAQVATTTQASPPPRGWGGGKNAACCGLRQCPPWWSNRPGGCALNGMTTTVRTTPAITGREHGR